MTLSELSSVDVGRGKPIGSPLTAYTKGLGSLGPDVISIRILWRWWARDDSNLRAGDYESFFHRPVRAVCSGLKNLYLRIGDKIHPGYERYRDGKIGLSMEEIVGQAEKQDKVSK